MACMLAGLGFFGIWEYVDGWICSLMRGQKAVSVCGVGWGGVGW